LPTRARINMETTRFGCLSVSGILAALIVTLIVAGITIFKGGVLFNPGALNAQDGSQVLGGVLSHADIPRCAACHAPFWSNQLMDERCRACHVDLLIDPQGFHSVMMAQGELTTCRDCHTDHNGAIAPLTTLALTSFPHDKVGFSLLGHQTKAAETAFACSDCHAGDFNSIDQAICESCHHELDITFLQAHVQTFGQDCLACHDGVDTYGSEFDHNQTSFPLREKHAELDCSACHQSAHSRDDLQAAPLDCIDCHAQDDAHAGEFGESCGGCHTSASWLGAEFDHSQSAFPLTGAHLEVTCQDCHIDNLYAGTPQECFTCHAEQDAHGGEFGGLCGECHSTTTWQGAELDHSLTAFPLTGAHLEVTCQQCHIDNLYAGTPQECFGCHKEDDAHTGEYGESCGECHGTVSWLGAEFDHSQTAFPLTGAHLQATCQGCHVDSLFAGTPQVCAACHTDPDYHLGLFAESCDRCHTTQAWSPAIYDLLHTFPINHGESGMSACQTCHPTSLSVYTCYECHEHSPAEIQSEHREEGISDFQDCMRCHPTGQEEEYEGGDD
jgi:hypothetical protein